MRRNLLLAMAGALSLASALVAGCATPLRAHVLADGAFLRDTGSLTLAAIREARRNADGTVTLPDGRTVTAQAAAELEDELAAAYDEQNGQEKALGLTPTASPAGLLR
jgi:hypothetical protein